ncbi:MAG: esterase, partial [Gammaproteobacteria bacterium]|nr:esterase [Gammaproteobacteria bacterium]
MRSVIIRTSILMMLSLISQSIIAEVAGLTVSLPEGQVAYDGRLFIVFSRDDEVEPRFLIGDEPAPLLASPFFAAELKDWDGSEIEFDPAGGFPLRELGELEAGTWHVQALFDLNDVFSELNAPGNLYSEPQLLEIDASSQTLSLALTESIPEETLPEDTELLKFVRIRSELLSEFYQRDIYLRASVLLPAGYATESDQRFPVLYHVAGLNGRYTRSLRLLQDEKFMDYWRDGSTRPAVIVFLDGESPFGDSYQVNSAVSGPYADANFGELFPYLSDRFPIDDRPTSRFLSGCSTGGWVSMALQILYPDYFNGAYSLSPDSPSFRAFQLVNLYQDDNAFYSPTGMTRPSARETNGDPLFSIADEIRMEAAMGTDGRFVNSGQQWGAWNAVHGQPDENGNPI